MDSVKQIGAAFSAGNFASVYPFMADDIAWHVVGGVTVKSKKDVITYCDKMLLEMDGSLVNTHYIENGNSIAVQGYCNYTNPDNTPGRVEYCDVYRFNDLTLAEITSYCIEIKSA